VARLHHILALRGLGLGLADIAEVLDGTGPPIGDLLARQLLEVEQRLASGRRVRHVLRALLATVAEEDLDPIVLTEKIKETTELMTQLTPEQRHELEDRRRTMMAALSDTERTEMTRRRDRAMAQLTAQECEDMARSRAAMMGEQP
jgi:DNA-binding transcriptional MerR regulator